MNQNFSIIIQPVSDRNNGLTETLLELWEASVRQTHDFLSEETIKQIKPQVLYAIKTIEFLLLAMDSVGNFCGFMGVEGDKIEMLFILPEKRGAGIGRKLMGFATETLKANLVDVNEQNTQGVDFYLHLGFSVIRRSPFDAQDRPFPILHLKKQTLSVT